MVHDPLFPTRSEAAARGLAAGSARAADAIALTEGPASGEAPNLYAHLVGADPPGRRPLTSAERDSLQDLLARLFARGRFPLTLSALLAEITALDGTSDALPRRQVFAVA